MGFEGNMRSYRDTSDKLTFAVVCLVAFVGLGASPCASVPDEVSEGAEEVTDSNKSDESTSAESDTEDDSSRGEAKTAENSGDDNRTEESRASASSSSSSSSPSSDSSSSKSENAPPSGWRGTEEASSVVRNHQPERCDDPDDWISYRRNNPLGDEAKPLLFDHEQDFKWFCTKRSRQLSDERVQHRYPDEIKLRRSRGVPRGYKGIRLKTSKILVENRLIGEPELTDAQKTVYRAAHVASCYGPSTPYLQFVGCRAFVKKVPSPEDVRAVLEKRLPGQTWEHGNFLLFYKDALRHREENKKEYAKLEKKHPKLKEAFADSTEKALKRFREVRDKYPDMFEKLDPLTEKFLENAPPPENCEDRVLELRETLKDDIPPTDPSNVRRLVASHPLGYQITEALAYCYSDDDDASAKLIRAKKSTDNTKRQVNWVEYVVAARELAVAEFNKKLSSREIEHHFPNEFIEMGAINVRDDPLYEYSNYLKMPVGPEVPTYGNDSVKLGGGKGAIAPNVIKSKKKVDNGVKITFESTETFGREGIYECWETDKVQKFIHRGGETIAVYEKCKQVDSKRKKTGHYQHDPIILSEDEATHLETGMGIQWYYNSLQKESGKSAEDAALKNAFWPNKPKGEREVVVQGVKLE